MSSRLRDIVTTADQATNTTRDKVGAVLEELEELEKQQQNHDNGRQDKPVGFNRDDRSSSNRVQSINEM